MIFPDGTKKEGYFENNVFKVKVQITQEQQELERRNNARPAQAFNAVERQDSQHQMGRKTATATSKT